MSAVRYTTKTRLRALELRKLGWTYEQIRKILADEGFDPVPSKNTLSCWTNPDVASRQLARGLRNDRRKRVETASFGFSGRRRSPDWVVGRILSLAAAGMTASAISQVMTHDFPERPFTRYQVADVMRDRRVPYALRRAA